MLGMGLAAASCILGCVKHRGLSIAKQQRGWSCCCCSALQVQPTGQGRAGVARGQGFGMLEMAGVWGFCCWFGVFLVAVIAKLKWILLGDMEGLKCLNCKVWWDWFPL